MDDTDAEFYEVRFASETDLEAARKVLVVKAELGSGAVLVSADMMSADEIMEAAAAAGVELPEIGDSGITDDDMWPEWTEDSMDEDERSFAIAL